MADETFRPEKKRINSLPTSEENLQNLEAMARMRQAVAEDADEDDGREPSRPTGRAPVDQSGDQVKISGNIPPQFAAMLKAQGGKTPDETKPRMNQARRQTGDSKPARKRDEEQQYSVQTGGSDLLKKLIETLRESDLHQYEEITLPSLGKFYDGDDGPTDGKLLIRPMTGEEEQILATPRFVKKGQAINMIFSRCMKGNYKPEDFLTVDRTFFLIYLRGISYTPEYDVEVKCPECEKKFAHTIDLNQLDVNECPDDYGPTLEGVLPKSQYAFRYKLSRGRDETKLQEYRERKIRMFGDTADDSLAERSVMLLEDIEGLTDREELKKLLVLLPINDVSHLRSIVGDPPFGVNTQVEINCPNCIRDFTVDLPLEANFFFPKARKKDQTRA